MSTAAALWDDYMGLRRNVRRLGQVAAIQYRRWAEHDCVCPYAPDEDDEDDVGCPECERLLFLATVYGAAHGTVTGQMIWQ